MGTSNPAMGFEHPRENALGSQMVAIGTTIARRSPHRSRRAKLPHRLLQYAEAHIGDVCSVLELISTAS